MKGAGCIFGNWCTDRVVSGASGHGNSGSCEAWLSRSLHTGTARKRWQDLRFNEHLEFKFTSVNKMRC